MKSYEIVFRPRAKADLLELYDYIAEREGLALAGGYIDRVEAACLSLQTFPERGARRDEVAPGLRVMGFERRASILFTIKKREVQILRVLYGGRDIERVLREM